MAIEVIASASLADADPEFKASAGANTSLKFECGRRMAASDLQHPLQPTAPPQRAHLSKPQQGAVGGGGRLRPRARSDADETSAVIAELVAQQSDWRVAIWLRVRFGGQRLTTVAREHGYRDVSGVHRVVNDSNNNRPTTDRSAVASPPSN